MRKMVNQHINRILRIILYFSAFQSVTRILPNQHINKEMTHLRTHWSKFEFNSWSIMDKMVNQHINRNLRTMPYFFSDCLLSNQHINRKFHSHWVKFELYSWSGMAILVNQQINGNLRAITYFQFFWSVN